MASRNNYSEKEWKLLVFSPSFTANAIATSDGSITKNETLAITQSLLKARNEYSKTHLVYMILNDLPGMIENQDFPGELRYVKTIDEAERAFRKLAKIVDTNATPAEAEDYKNFIASIANTVAKASGSFMKIFGEDVTADEFQYFNVVKKALGLP